jgi:phosphatidylserine/phosphatidylglycerophosphate/cardiolipin synthase-like enzyme
MRGLVILCGLAAGVASANLLQNPSFESWIDDSTPSAWQVETRSRTGVVRELDTVHSGVSSCRMVRRVAGTGNNSGLAQRVAVTPDAEYIIHACCWDDSDQVSAGLSVSWRAADSSYISSSGVTHSLDSSGWQTIEDSVHAPAGAAFGDFLLRTYGAGGASPGNRVLVDDARFDTPAPRSESLCIWFVQDSLARRLTDFLNAATTSLDYCCYSSSRPDVVLALIAAHNRGVQVRVITDNTRLNDSWVAFLRGSGIAVWSDSISNNSSNYMHDEFCARDLGDADSINDRTWVASYDPNENELAADCALEIPGTALARAYLAEFEQMWGGSGPLPNPTQARFHNSKTDVLATHEFAVNDRPAYLYFSPQNRVVDTITAFTGRARREVAFAINAFTHDDLGDAMLDLWQRGSRVLGTFDQANAGDSASEYFRLRAGGVRVLIDSVPFGNKTLHEKIMVIDSSVTVTGSADWSSNANYSNDENTLILTDSVIAARFHSEIVTRYAEAGGRYPPAIAGPVSPPACRARPVLRSPRLGALPAGAVVFDPAGRRLSSSRLGAGVYFVRLPDRPVSAIIVVR